MINNCHPAGKQDLFREYNPMEQSWCQEQALEPDKIHIDGPHLHPNWHDRDEFLWSLTVGKAIYDRVTNAFIGCIEIALVLDFLKQVLVDTRVTEHSEVTVVRWDSRGTVIASSARNMTLEPESISVNELNVGVSTHDWTLLKNLVDYDDSWDGASLREAYEFFFIEKDGFVVGAYPIPPPPTSHDPYYRPDFLVITSIWKDDIFRDVYTSLETVDDNLKELVRLSLTVGVVGIAAVIFIVAMVSNRLTSPLNFMNDVANEIVNN